MEQSEFTELYERYLAQCVRAGVEPLTPEAIQTRLRNGSPWDCGGTLNHKKRGKTTISGNS
jgi:hypothetical protein